MQEISGKGIFQVVKAACVAIVCSLLLCAVYALILRLMPMGQKGIVIVTQVIKGLSLVVATLLFIRGEKGIFKGVAAGVLFTVLGYLAFSSLGGDFSLSWWIVVELLVFCVVGGLSGVVAVNLRGG